MPYKKLKNTWANNYSENFFVTYAVNGSIVNPLNTRWMYEKPWPSIDGIL